MEEKSITFDSREGVGYAIVPPVETVFDAANSGILEI